MAGQSKSIKIDIDTDASKAVSGFAKIKGAATDAKKVVDELNTPVEVKVGADTSQAETRVDKVKAQIKGLSASDSKVVIDANVAALESKLKKAKSEITSLSDEDVQLQVEVIGEGEKQLRQLKEMAEKVDAEKVTIDVDTSKVDEATGHLSTAKGKIEEVGKSADSSKSVLANMVGNSVQDLGNLGGIAGSTGVAIGQMGEYFADATLAGEGFASAIGSFALVAGPVLALSLAVAVLPKIFESLSGKSEQLTKDTEDLAKAFAGLEDADPASRFEALGKKIDEVLQNSPHLAKSFQDLGIAGSDVADTMTGEITPAVQRVKDEYSNLTDEIASNVRTQQESAAKSGVAITAYDAEQKALTEVAAAHGLTKQELQNRLSVEGEAVGKIGELTDATTAATEQDDIRRQVLGTLTGAQDSAGISADEYKASVEAVTSATEASRQALLDQADALKAQSDGMRAAADAQFAADKSGRDLQQAVLGLDDQIKTISKSTDDATTKQLKIQQAYDDVAQSASDNADAQVRLASEQSAAAGVTVTATQKLDGWNAAMLTSAASSDGPLHDAIINHIAAVNGIPPEKVTEILASTPNLEEQKKLLDQASANRALTIKADADTSAAQTSVDAFIRSIQAKKVYIDVGARTGNVSVATAGGTQSLQPPRYAGGGMVSALVGERGPEPALLPTGTNITPNERARNWIQTEARRAAGGNAGPTRQVVQNIYLSAGPFDSERDVMNKVARVNRRYQRWNGSFTLRDVS